MTSLTEVKVGKRAAFLNIRVRGQHHVADRDMGWRSGRWGGSLSTEKGFSQENKCALKGKRRRRRMWGLSRVSAQDWGVRMVAKETGPAYSCI